MGACMLVRRAASTRSALFDEDFFLFSEETDWCYRFQQAGWKVLFFPGAEFVHVDGAVARRPDVQGERPRPPPLPREAPRAARGRAARRLLLAALRLRALVYRGERGQTYRERPAGSRPARVRSCSARRERTRCAVACWPAAARRSAVARLLPETGVGLFLRLARGDRLRAAARAARRRALGLRSASGDAGVERWRRCPPRSASCSLLHASLDARAVDPARDRRRRPRRCSRRARIRVRSRPQGAAVIVGIGLALGALRARAGSRPRPCEATGSSTSRACASSSTSAGCSLSSRGRVLRRRPAPRLRVPALARLPRRSSRSSPASTRRSSSSTRRRCSCRWPCSSRTRPAVALFRSRARRRLAVARRAGRADRVRARARWRVHGARPARDRSRQLLVPAVLALFFALRRATARATALASIAAASLALALVHPTYALFVLRAARWLRRRPLRSRERDATRGRRRGARRGRRPDASRVALALLPDRRARRSRTTPSRQTLDEPWRTTSTSSTSSRTASYRLAPEVFARSGRGRRRGALCSSRSPRSRARRRWASFVLGGSIAVLALMLTARCSSRTSRTRSRSRSRGAPPASSRSRSRSRAGAPCSPACSALGGAPARARGRDRLPARLPGRLRLLAGTTAVRRSRPGSPLFGGAAALVAGDRPAPRCASSTRRGHAAALGARLFIAARRAARLHALGRATSDPGRRSRPGSSPRCDRRARDGPSSSPTTETSYAIAAVRAGLRREALPTHVADTTANRPYARRHDALVFFRTGNLAIPRRYGATWLVVDRARSNLKTRPAAGAYARRRRYVPLPSRSGEGPPRHAVLPARRRRRRPAPAQDRRRTCRHSASRRTCSRPTTRSGCTATTSSQPPTQAWVHRARYVGPRGRRPAEELYGKHGRRARRHPGAAVRPSPARPRRERVVEPDRDPGGDPHRAPRGDRRRA